VAYITTLLQGPL